MSAGELQRWMKQVGKNEVDIASALKISPQTVTRFLAGKSVRPIIQAALERLVKDQPAGTRVAAG